MSTFKADYIIARQEEIAGNTSSIPVKTVVNGTAKAWVNFNGTGTIAIRANFNTASLSDNGTGDYTVNFATALSDANYSVVAMNAGAGGYGSYGLYMQQKLAPTTSTCALTTLSNAGTAVDSIQVNVTINR